MNLKAIYVLLLVLYALVKPADSLADEKCLSLHVIQNKPIGYMTDSGAEAGVHWEYLSAIEDESGVCIKKQLMPYARIWKSIQQGNHDGGIIFSSPQRNQYVELVGLIREVKTVVVAAKSYPIKEYDDLYSLTIGKTRGTHLNDRFDRDNMLSLVQLTNYEQAALMLSKGRINAMAGSAPVLSYQLSIHNVANKLDFANKVTLGSRGQWLQLSKSSKHLDKTNKLSDAIERLKKNGKLDQIMAKYYGTNWHVINQ